MLQIQHIPLLVALNSTFFLPSAEFLNLAFKKSRILFLGQQAKFQQPAETYKAL